jgi:CDP-6-deoxy-D-xylo-4-hexulose-3-dehydrase
MICCKSSEDYEIIKALRSHGWSRGLKNEKKISKKFKSLDKKFIFYNSGYNLRSTDIAASIGLSQFRDLTKFIKIRNINRNRIVNEIKKNKKINSKIDIIQENKSVKASWFGMPIMLRHSINKKKFINKIERNGIETRPIISGNFLNQPSVKKYKLNKGKMKNADDVNKNGFFIGLPTYILKKNILKKIVKAFEKSL